MSTFFSYDKSVVTILQSLYDKNTMKSQKPKAPVGAGQVLVKTIKRWLNGSIVYPERSRRARLLKVTKTMKQWNNRTITSIFIFVFLIVIFNFSFLIFNLGVNAQEMSSQNFIIQGGNFNMTSGNKTSTNFKLSDVVGQTAAGVFASKGYLIQAGFLNAAAAEVFSFSVTPAVVDFGSLFPNTPVEKNVRITISNGNVEGYSIFVSENQPLTTLVEAEIVDTACDQESTPCTHAQAAKWTDNTSYGFGYRLEGRTVPADFSQDNFYRPFTATKRNEEPVLIMRSQAKKVVDQATMTLRVNIGRNQPVGQYRNVLSFTAIAGI